MSRFSLQRRHCLATLGLAPAALAAAPGHEWRPWPRGRAAPALDLNMLDGGRWRLSEHRGRPVLANFWATWCEPCRDELPSLLRLAGEHAAQGLVLVGVNYREPAARVRDFLAARSLPLTVLMDPQGLAARAWTPRIFPSTVLIGRDGRPAGVLVGEIDWQGERARQLVAPLLRT